MHLLKKKFVKKNQTLYADLLKKILEVAQTKKL